MDPRTERTLKAGFVSGVGAIRALGFFVASLLIWVLLMQAFFGVVQSGPLQLIAGEQQPTGKQADVSVIHADDQQAAKIRRAVAHLRYQPPRAGLTFSVMDGPSPGMQGEYLPGVNVIQIRATVVDGGGILLERALAHEIGHFVDQTRFNDAQRAEYMRWRHIPPNMTWLSWNQSWQDRPVEDFAEVFACLDAPSPLVPPTTRYGQIQDSTQFVQQLNSVGVKFDHQVQPYDWQAGARQEASFVRFVATDPRTRFALIFLALFYVLLGAIPGWKRGWKLAPATRRARFPDAPLDPRRTP